VGFDLYRGFGNTAGLPSRKPWHHPFPYMCQAGLSGLGFAAGRIASQHALMLTYGCWLFSDDQIWGDHD